MDVFTLRKRVVDDYQRYITSFIAIKDSRIQQEVDANLDAGLLWPEPRIGLNPSFETGGLVDVQVGYGDIAVAVATNALADSTVAALRAAGIPVQTLENYSGETSATVKVGTHFRIKGLEFKQVFLPFLSANRFPALPAGVKDGNERLEHEERSLSQLFVAMTRARDRLFVTCTGDPADAIIGAIHRFEVQG